MNNQIVLTGAQDFETALKKLNQTDFRKVVRNNLTEMWNRSKMNHSAAQGGTPVYTNGGYTGGQLRNSAGIDANNGLFFYTAEYAPHVEYGHRQTPGRYVPAIGRRLVNSYVPGQHYLQNNVKIQQPKYIADLVAALQENRK